MSTRKFIPRPDSIKLGHRTLTVKYLTSEEWDAADYGDNRGITLHGVGLIAVLLDYDGDKVCEAMIRETLLHEILHACSNHSMLWNTWDHIRNKSWPIADEALVGATSPVLLGVIKENPQLVAYLMDDQEHE